MIDATGAQSLAIVSTTSSNTPSTVTDTLTLSTTAHTTLNITGNAALDLSPNWEVALMSVKTVAAGTFNAGLHIYLYGNTNDLDIAVGNGNDIVVAGFGNDRITTGAGDDIIFAGRAADIVNAGAGNDWIRGGPAKDVMTGGAGIDTYAYVFAYESSDSTGVDVITDFAAGAGGDLLDFTALTHGAATFSGNVNGAAAVNAALHTGSIRAVFDKGADILHVDLDANGVLDATNDIAIQLTGVAQLAAGNFIF
jgi:Ca2+-binding RTX toxin-like protein